MDQGMLVPDEVVIGMIDSCLDEYSKIVKGFLFDGFPRTTAQALALDELFINRGLDIDLVLSLEVSEEEIVKRILKYAQPGEDGVEEWNILELKILADVGLVGFPNAGKSTLLASISAAKPKIADYPFTTLTPNLGIVAYRNDRSFVMADIPGIIENAHLGKGLGHRFLRHIERNAALIFMVPADSNDIKKEYHILLNECKEFNETLLHKKRILAISKSDMLDEELKSLIAEQLPTDLPCVFISAVAEKGLMELKDLIWHVLNQE
ncbi:UNVERIFIED_CONTAM: hypothetical protein GTU68_025251 [Idotea baltica]|nr:hypothetical protein [Idotea baltica]